MKPLKTIDAETLLSTPLKPVHFVDGLLPLGLHLLGGSPKVGKSWLMLLLCFKVATGEPLWGFLTHQCGVLYLCLEDTFSRIQNRLFQITDTTPDNLHFAIMAEQIGTGLQEQITNFLKLHTDTRLMVIDTLQRIRGVSTDSNAYANDYRDLAALKEIADGYRMAFVVVHHLRKQQDSDPFLKVSGTTGLTGAVDSTLVLEKDKRTDDTAKLYVTGRDVEYQELTLWFEQCIWQLVSYEKVEVLPRPVIPPLLFRVVDFMKAHSRWGGSASELLSEISDTETPANTVTKLLNQHHHTMLAENGIAYAYKRTAKARTIYLTRCDGYDGGDSYDSRIPTEKEPSQLSLTVIGTNVKRGAGVSPATHLACKI